MSFTFVSDEDDTFPPEISPVEYELCSVEGCENPRAKSTGRGRKPTKCEEHKGSKSPSGSKSASRSTADKDVDAAARVLRSVVGMGGLGITFAGYPMTGSAIGNALDPFEESLVQALRNDPGMVKLLLSGGQNMGRMMLLVSFGQLGAAVLPVFMMEARAKKEARDAELSGV